MKILISAFPTGLLSAHMCKMLGTAAGSADGSHYYHCCEEWFGPANFLFPGASPPAITTLKKINMKKPFSEQFSCSFFDLPECTEPILRVGGPV